MAQIWGFAHWKLKLSSARPLAPKQSTGLFLSFGLPCSNPVLYSKNKKPQKRLFIFGADVGIRTPEASLKTYTISNRAPSASSDTSAYLMLWYYNLSKQKNQCLFFIIFNFKFICKIKWAWIKCKINIHTLGKSLNVAIEFRFKIEKFSKRYNIGIKEHLYIKRWIGIIYKINTDIRFIDLFIRIDKTS